MTVPSWRAGTGAVCVTGMHRSGTSFTMRALHLLGLELGSDETLMVPGPDNRAGYWENRLVKELDDELLAELGGSWDQPPLVEEGWERAEELDPWRDRAAGILETSFGGVAPGTTIGFKDPRLSLLLPFWRRVVDITTTIIVVRDPREVAAALATRNGLAPSHSALLWMRYLFAAARHDPGHMLLTHGEFFADTDGSVDRLVAHLGSAPPTPDVRRAIRAHLDPALRHQIAGDGDGDGATVDPVLRLALDVWNRGEPDLAALPPHVTDALGRGWLRAPADGEALTKARSDAVRFKEHLRARNEKIQVLTDEVEQLRAARAASSAPEPASGDDDTPRGPGDPGPDTGAGPAGGRAR
jgi:hypothetical protein